MNVDERPFRTLSSREVWSCPWYRVRQDDIVTPNGQDGVYHVIEKADAVWIVPVTADGQIAMVRQYRYTVDDWCWEIPAGSLKPGQTADEAAQEELSEEVGGIAERLDFIGRFYPANGICNETGFFFLATGVALGATHHEAAEVMEVHLFTIEEALAMAQEGQITDGPSALALLLCADRLKALAK